VRKCRVILSVLLCTMLSTFFTGCFDAREVSFYAYVLSIGLDRGITDDLRMTIQIPNVKGSQNSGGNSQGQGEITTMTIDCPTFYSGVNMMNTFLSRQLNYTHTEFMVFSESLAKEGIDKYLTAFNRGRQIRRQINVIIARGTASEFLKENTLVIGSSLPKKQQDLMDQSYENGLFSNVLYGDMINEVKTTYGQSIATLAAVNKLKDMNGIDGSGDVPYKSTGDYYAGELTRSGGSKDELLGTAVFDGGRMVGELNGDETRALLMIRNEFKKGYFSIQDPKKPELVISLNINKEKNTETKVNIEKDKPVIDVKVYLEGDILSVQSTIDYESKDLKLLLENDFKKQMKDQIDKTIKKCQDLNSEVFKFGRVAAMHFLTIQEWEKYDWLSKFKQARVNTEVEFKISRTGTMIKSAEIRSTDGKKGE
jgi:spore germination protein KC